MRNLRAKLPFEYLPTANHSVAIVGLLLQLIVPAAYEPLAFAAIFDDNENVLSTAHDSQPMIALH